VGEPRFSIITPVYETPAAVLRAMLRSVRRQRYGDWELCIVDDASSRPHVGAELEEARREDPRIRVERRAENGGIVAASNDALAMARGEFLVLLDHDDKLHPDALTFVAEALDADPEGDYLYTDEDKIDRVGIHSGPFCKPDWSPERMRTQMYTCHLSVLRRSLVEEVGGFDPEFEGSQDWDLVLKVTERARSVVHVPRVLYHWRAIGTSAAADSGEEVKPWAFEAGRRAVQSHCERIGLQARVERDDKLPGVYHLQPDLSDQPRVSIVIPTNGQRREIRYREVALVEHCVRSIVETSTYENYEIVCVADASTDASLLTELSRAAAGRLRVVTYDEEFNFAAKINLGAKHSEGELLLLLNDDMEVVTPDWIERLAMYARHPGIGAAGARLLWEDGRLQHAGVIFENGLPGHIYRGYSGEFKGYSNNACVAQNYLAVTGACMMTSAASFDRVGGFSPELPVNYNDVDYCLKLRAEGMRVVYDPDTVLFHFESSSRSMDVQEWEKQTLLERWLPLTASDPSGNPNLAHGMPRLRAHFAWASRRRPRREHSAGCEDSSSPTDGTAATWIFPTDETDRGNLLGAAVVAAERECRPLAAIVEGADRAEEAIAAARESGLLIVPAPDAGGCQEAQELSLLRRARAEGWRLLLLSAGADSASRSGDLVEEIVTRMAAIPEPDRGLPVPPDALRRRVSVGPASGFYRTGLLHVECFEDCLAAAGTSFAESRDILDWGAGCGRMTANLLDKAAAARVTAADTDAEAVAWIAEHLEAHAVQALPVLPPSPLEESSFDVVVGHSVFSHLGVEAQDRWLEELARVTRPGGHIAVSFNGPLALRWHLEHPLVDVPESVESEVAREGIGVWRDDGWEAEFYEGYHTTFHDHDYVRRHWSRWAEVVEIHEARALPTQDIAVLRAR